MYYLTLSSYHIDEGMRLYYRKKAEWATKLLEDQLDKYDTYIEQPGYTLGVDFPSLIAQFRKSLNYFEELGDQEIQANILVGIIMGYSELDDTEQFEENSAKLKKLFTDIDEIYPVFLLSIYKMNDLLYTGDIEVAKDIELELIQLISRRKNDNVLGLIASTMATNYRERGRWALAIEYYLKSLEVFSQTVDPEMVSRINFHLGVSYENLGMNSKAAESYLKSIGLLEAIQDSSNLLNPQLSLGIISNGGH